MKVINLFLGILFGFCSFSQSNVLNLPELLPPSPEVSAITKDAALSSNLHTGASNVNIPIYNLQVKGFSLPISLNYTTNGFKPAEISSRVGMGWSLNAGGVVSRIVQGKPDDESIFQSPLTTIGYNIETLGYLDGISNPIFEYDSRPDEFRYSLNGISGKFIFKRDGSILQIPYNNVKITAAKTGGSVNDITITDASGIKYFFAETEKTILHSNNAGYLNKQDIKTAWMLSFISLPTGEKIEFNY